LDEGLALATGTDTPLEVSLRIEELRFLIRVDFDADRAVAAARSAVDLAGRLAHEESRCHTLLGSALLIDGSPEWEAAISRGRTLARGAGDVDAEMEAANALCAAHLFSGDRRVARQVASEACRTARLAHRRHWEEQFGVLSNLLGLIAGDVSEVAEWGRREVGPHLCAGVQTAYATYAVALGDLGHQHLALRVIQEGLELDSGDASGRSLLKWAEAETRWLFGQQEKALDAAEASLSCGVGGFPVRPLAGAVRAWCQYDLGLPVSEVAEEGWDFARAAKVESTGISLLAAGDHIGAARCFAEAVSMIDDAPRFQLRARWGLGESWRMAGELECATTTMLEVHAAAQRLGLMALHGRSHRSLHRLGWEGARGEAEPGPLTHRQVEVLMLVGRGHTTLEIASILGLRPSTVDTHIGEAMAQLGATTRAQAVLLAEVGATGDDPPSPCGRM